MTAPWTASALAEIPVEWLQSEIAPASHFGRRAKEAERCFGTGDEAHAREAIARVDVVAREVEPQTIAAIRAAIAACPDPSDALVRAAAGATLNDSDFFELARFMDGVAAVRNLSDHSVIAAVASPPWQKTLAAALAAGRGPGRTFYVDDAFDAELAAARSEAAALRARLDGEKSRLRSRVAAYAGLDDVRDGEFVLMRERAPAPLPSELRVVREAATYYLCELALDAAALSTLALLEAAQARVAEREEAVRSSLSAAVRESANSLAASIDALGVLDAFMGRVRFAQRYGARAPEIVDAALVEFDDARLLPLEASLSARGHRYAPLSASLAGIGVLTGPNMGGKTAALRTVGFVAACVALGVPVPAACARVGLFEEIAWIGMGTEPEVSLLSSFGREVAQLRDFLARGARRALVLVDEFARTTSPREGRALLVALVERLSEERCVGLVATHLSRIAEDAGVPHFAVAGLRELPKRPEGPVDLDAALDRIADVMDYRVRRVSADEASRGDAIALADVLGLDAALIARARAAL